MKVTIEVDDKDINRMMQRLNRISRSPHGEVFFEAFTAALQTASSVKIYDRPAKAKAKAKATRRPATKAKASKP